MRIVGHPFPVLNSAEISTIHQGALRILAEMGMEIQNDKLLAACEAAGFAVDHPVQRVRFPSPGVEKFIAEAEKFDWENLTPTVTSTAGVYHGRYHDPATGELQDWTEKQLADYFALARALPNVGTCSLLGSRLPVPAPLEPLYERYYCWKYGAAEGGSIDLDPVCPYLLDLYQARADQLKKPLAEVFVGNVYLVPAMKLGRHEAYQVAYFWERGLRVEIGDMLAMGANTPVTAAGAVTLNLAERLALGLLNFALWGEKKLHLACSLFPFDMKTMIFPFGRPEGIAPALMTAQLARYYGVPFWGHGGLTSAKLPSAEAGYQKALTAVPILLAGGNFWLDAGLLSIDEVYSPIQMVLDDEFLGALKHLCKEVEISDESLGLGTILEVGPGGTYVDQAHTARHFRQEQWQPQLWTRSMLGPWLDSGAKLDVDLARERALELIGNTVPESAFDPEFDRQLMQVIEHARKALVPSDRI